jgi:hypothetical protein
LIVHRTSTNESPGLASLEGISYRSLSGGIRRYRAEVNPRLKPRDTIGGLNDETFGVGMIPYVIGKALESMELQET